MTNLELQKLLQQYPDDMPLKLLIDSTSYSIQNVIDFEDENILHTSTTASVNPDAPDEEWDCEDGKIELGLGDQFLLINPIIF